MPLKGLIMFSFKYKNKLALRYPNVIAASIEGYTVTYCVLTLITSILL